MGQNFLDVLYIDIVQDDVQENTTEVVEAEKPVEVKEEKVRGIYCAVGSSPFTFEINFSYEHRRGAKKFNVYKPDNAF